MKLILGGKPVSREEYIRQIIAQAPHDKKDKAAYFDYFNKMLDYDIQMDIMNQKKSNVVPIIGAVVLALILALVYLTPAPSYFQSGVLWIILALSAAACAAAIPGFFEFKFKGFVRATGAIGVFALIFFVRPVGMEHNEAEQGRDLTVYFAKNDTVLRKITIKKNIDSKQEIKDYLTGEYESYFGTSFSRDSNVCYRASDGMIYSNQKCAEIKDEKILIVPVILVSHFGDKREAYIHFAKLISAD